MPLRLAVLGDSIAAGQGARRAEDALGARLVRSLSERGIEARLSVYAASGARSSALRRQVDRAVRAGLDVAVIVVGANDITHRTPPADAARDLGEAVRRLREAGAEVVVAPAPDLSAVPHVPPALRPVVQVASTDLRVQQVSNVTDAGGRVADADGVTTRAFAADATLFSADRFHPSSEGYAVIAEALLPTVHDAASSHTQAARATRAARPVAPVPARMSSPDDQSEQP